MDETTGSLGDWFSSTVKSVGSTVANAWADQWTARHDEAAATTAPPPGAAPVVDSSALLMKYLPLLAFGLLLYKLARG